MNGRAGWVFRGLLVSPPFGFSPRDLRKQPAAMSGSIYKARVRPLSNWKHRQKHRQKPALYRRLRRSRRAGEAALLQDDARAAQDYGSRGSEWVLVCPPDFKSARGDPRGSLGGFDSHTLPPPPCLIPISRRLCFRKGPAPNNEVHGSPSILCE